MPLLTLGMGLSSPTAGLVLTFNTAVMIAVGPLHGILSSRLDARRDRIVLLGGLLTLCSWVLFFFPSHPRGVMAAIGMNFLLGLITPTSNYGFDYVRERMERSTVATGTGLANMGGFIAGMIAGQTTGFLLDQHSDGAALQWDDFRFAWVGVTATVAVGVIGLLVSSFYVRRTASMRIVNTTDDS